jgi:hypothetical protein
MFDQGRVWSGLLLAPARLRLFAIAPVSTMDRNNFDRNEHTTNPVTACCRIALLL